MHEGAGNSRLSVLIISFSEIVSDPRVLKQVKLLSAHFDVTTCGHGSTPDGVVGHVEVPAHLQAWRKDRGALLLRRYRAVYKRNEAVSYARDQLPLGAFDVIVANDIEAVGLALALRARGGVHADLHEYAPGQNSQLRRWRLFVAPYLRWLCRRDVQRARSVTTVSPAIAERYRRDLGVEVGVVMNATPYAELSATPTRREAPIRLVHSGNAMRSRGLDVLIRAVEATTSDVSLDLYLVPNEPDYLAELRAMAAGSARVRIHDPVPYVELVPRLNEYDVGIHVLPPVNFNNLWALPNKLFDYVQARLGIIVGPSPEMARLVRERGLGSVTEDFTVDGVTRALDELDADRVDEWRKSSDRHARELSGEVQSQAWLDAARAIGASAHHQGEERAG